MTAHKITDREPVFPCWLWKSAPLIHEKPLWLRFESLAAGPYWAKTVQELVEAGSYTHWHPDQPAAPTETPGEPQGPTCDRCKAPLNEGEAKCFTVCDACWDATKAQPTPEAVPMWVKEAAIELHSEAWHGLTYNAMIELTAKAIARHAPPPVGEVTPNKGDGKARYIVVPRDEAITYAAYCSGMSGKSIRVAENTVPEFIECAKKLGLEPTECAAMRSGREGEKS